MTRGSRHGAAFLLCGALLVVPLLLIQNGSDASATPQGQRPGPAPTASASGPGTGPTWKLASQTRRAQSKPRSGVVAGPATTVPPTVATTTTTGPPPTSVPSAEVVQRSAEAPATTTVTVPPTTTTTSPPVAATGSVRYGQVTYYAHPAGTCASPFLPFGTVVRVTNPANGLSTTCLVNDREADTARSIDLATATFAELAPLSQGVIDAQLTW
ncbi:MAG TPA: septal ring lytic transglycosylase RlpA family protein [Acidimicrobiales bacterium]